MNGPEGWPEHMLRLPVRDVLKRIGGFFLHIQSAGLSDHFHHDEAHPAPYVEIAQGELTFPPLPVPDIAGRDIPTKYAYGSEGEYM